MAETPNSVMIFAAGFGTRMGAMTKERPKPLLPVAGKPLIDHAIGIARGANVSQITANLHYHPEMLGRHLSPQGIQLSLEQPEILETGGGLRHALPLTGEGAVFTLNSDTIWQGPNPLLKLSQAWRPDKMDALLLLIPRDKALGHGGKGDFMIEQDGNLARGPGMVYSGAQIIKTSGLHAIPEHAFSLNRLWDIMKKQNRLFGLPYQGNWCDVGSPEGLVLADEMLGPQNV